MKTIKFDSPDEFRETYLWISDDTIVYQPDIFNIFDF